MDETGNSMCPQCGRPVEKGWKFCPLCEHKLVEDLCPGCGKSLEPEWKLCPFCGTRLQNVAGEEEVREESYPDRQPAFQEPLTGMRFVYVAGGRFEMGDLAGDGAPDEQPVHLVRLDGFYMATCPVTQRQWQLITGENPSRFKGDDLPVEQVTWKAARHFAELLSRMSGSGFRFDLPSEAQWEYAARGGGQRQRWAGGAEVEQLGWIAENSEGRTMPVGRKRPNCLGLYDMSGNVWEWCRDDYLPDAYKRHAQDNPVVSGTGSEKVLRGGAWHLDAWSARCTRRFSLDPTLTGPGVGLRIIAVKA